MKKYLEELNQKMVDFLTKNKDSKDKKEPVIVPEKKKVSGTPVAFACSNLEKLVREQLQYPDGK